MHGIKLLIGGSLSTVLAVSVVAAALAEPAGALKPVRLPHVQQLTITITGRASDEQTSPGNIAVGAGVPVRITVMNYTREFHTFTIPGLNVSALIHPARSLKARATTFTFTANQFGSFAWHCAFCTKGVHGLSHPMDGTVYVIINPKVLP